MKKSNSAKTPTAKSSVADRIVARLKGFTAALEKEESLAERFTCRKVTLKLLPQPYAPRRVKQARKELGLSQALFAMFLNVDVKTVQAWEQGANPPSGAACRLLDEFIRQPAYWRRRFLESAVRR